MKKAFKQIVAAVLVAVMLISSAPVLNLQASAVNYSGSSSYMSGTYYKNLCNVSLSGNQAADIVRIAESQVGYRSGSSSNDLSGSTSSKSNVKYSEYGRVIGYNPADWCAYFVSWCARQAGVSTSVLPNFAGCTSAYNSILPNAGCVMHRRSSGYVPKQGDIIFFGSRSDYIYHVGIVKYSEGGRVYYIDGNNTSTIPHCVKNSNASLSYSEIWGYATPNYSNQETNNSSNSNIKPLITGTKLTCPTQVIQGSAFYFTGVISSNKPITSAGILIKDSSGNEVSYASKIITPKTYYVDISKEIDPYIHMSQLPVGTYSYSIIASCESNIINITGLGNVSYSGETLRSGTFKVVSSGSNKSEVSEYVNIQENNNADLDSFVDLDTNYSTGTYKATPEDGLNVRTGPGTNYDKNGGYGQGETFEITAVSGNWGKCDKGWVCLDYATKISSSSSNSSSGYVTGWYRVITQNYPLNVRNAPGTSGTTVLKQISRGTCVAITETFGNWGKYEDGWICLDYTSFVEPITEPVINVPAAPKLSRTSAENAACGTALTVTWSPAADATCYDVYLKNSSGTVCQKLIGTNGNSASFTVNDAGTYYVTAYSRNTKYTSDVSNTINTKFHAPSTVNFVDWDGTVLSSQTVAYGTSATTPGNPSRYGWTFEKWNGNYNTVTENRTITATYKRNVYSISFLDENGDLIGSKQKVEFEGAATAPDYTAPEGYTFLGWDKEFDYIESNLTIKPVNVWSNEDLPVYLNSTSNAVRESTGYVVNAVVTNNPDSATDGRVIVALKTEEDKLLSMTESAAFHLKANGSETIKVFMPYDKAAAIAEIYVVENFSTAIPISAVMSIEIEQGTAWTNWSTTAPPDEAYQVESRTEYRSKTKSTTTSSSSTLSGWELYNKTWTWSSYGSWSGWTDSYIAETDSRDVETRTVEATAGYTQYRYGSYYNGSKSYFCPCHISGEWLRYTEWSTTKYYPTKYSAWYCPNNGYYDNYTINGLNYYWEESRYIEPTYKTQYRYRDRSKVYTYYFEKWSDWTDWSTTAVTSTDSRTVETRTTYRYLANDPSLVADTSGTVRTISGTLDASLAGEQATLFIYKVDEASDFTNEYVGQTVIADDGSYSFTFKLREEPSIKTGDYTVTLGIEGTSAAIYLDPIEAPKPQYTVEFIDWDGTPIETQTVTEGENAIIPETIPEREGYDFICWNNTGTNVKDDMTISPVYRIKTYTVVFVDWTNETVEMQTYEHGQPLAAPVLEDTVDEKVVGWDAILDGTTAVTQNMIITAKYETKTFTVKFLDSDNTVLDSQTVEYGESVTVPESLSSENAVLYDWDTSSSLTTVTEDQIVVPMYYYKETVTNPTSGVVTGEYDEAQTVELTCENEDAVIYYSLDGTDPLAYGTEYTKPFIIDSSCELKYAACAFEMNDSEIVTELIAINDGNAENMHIVTLYGECWLEEFSMLIAENELVSIEEAEYTRDGYDFIGVYIDADYTNEWNLETDVVTESIDLFFKWTPKTYTATFIGYEGEILSEQSVLYSEYAEMPEVPDIDGYVFCGFDKDSFVITEDTTFTAKYVPEDEFVTVSLNKSKYRLFKGTSTTLIATLTPTDVENSYVYWTSSDENVAVVDDNGQVTAVGTGTAEIYAISSVTGHAAVCKITVLSNIDEDITLVDDTDAGFDSEGQLRGVSVGENTVAEVAALFENTSLTFVDINGNELADDDLVGTGTIIKLINGDEVADEVIVVVTGDYNGDGLINNRDAAMITRYLVDKEVASLAQLTAIDVNGDGYVNNRDASMVSRYLVGKETI